ncbi:FtsK/SpoIIIE domain-containing protein [Thalassobacillus sp. C254]|uniref:FtsK/SpoIIIE domain-containing protein n=1 Tax=Thalassobacillus sp. C254 TaxID=1225341 RepID=UPI000B2C8FB2|nr:FtsK/SpoIIIE domain-containing protein [Thalassobacillus sp. C254]
MVREVYNNTISDSNLIAPLGLSPLNDVLSFDLSDPDTPHMLVGGTTGSGKSVTLTSIILSMMCLYSEKHLQFVFIDPKQVEFTFFEGASHTQDVLVDVESAVTKLEELAEEMDKRYSLMRRDFVSDIKDYNKDKEEKLPHIIIVFDEFADFMMGSSDIKTRMEDAIQRLGQKARAAGIHLIMCTQSPKAEIINTKIRNNLPARLALRTFDATASNIILDEDGAERLGGKGDFIMKKGLRY